MAKVDNAQAGAWRPLRQTSLTLRIRDEILRFLGDRRLRPGDRLPSERELATLLGVSRPSVREAVRALQSEGRLVVRHGQGVFVAEPESARELRRSILNHDHGIEELYAMREVLEVPAARWAAQIQDRSGLRDVQQAYDLLVAASERDPVDYETVQQLDMGFHLAIVQASGNRFLEQTQGVLHSILAQGMETTLKVPGRMEKSREDHTRILAAILAGDRSAAARAARNHVRAARAAAYRRAGAEEASRE